MSGLQDRVALVMGAGAGMGLASARALAAQGAAVVLADRDGEAIERAAKEIDASGGRATTCQVDVSSLPQLRSMIDFVENTHGKLNVLYCGVGARCASGMEITEEDFDLAFDVNVRSAYFSTTYALPLLRKGAPHASVIYMASGAGLHGGGRSALYSISKAGVVMMARTFAHFLAPQGIRSNVICPGPVDTAFPRDGAIWDEAKEQERLEHWSKVIPLGRIAQPEDIAALVTFLGSDQSMYLTGLSIPVDGGMNA